MLYQNARRKALYNPLVVETFIGRQALLGVPLQTPSNQVDETLVGILPKFDHDVAYPLFLLLMGKYFERGWHRVVFELRE